jgi:NAD(P)-dependent dehydrogenase (short-subunit alcohol dehydrogenase family)
MPAERRYAIVTGSAGGLGRALAVRLAREAYQLALVDIDETANRETATVVAAAGGNSSTHCLDVTDAVGWRHLADRLRIDWPRVDLLINNAGIAGSGDVGDFPVEQWQRMLDVNLRAAVLGCHTFAQQMKEQGSGHVVNVASFAAFACLPGMAAYNVSKAGVLALSETLRIEWAPHGIGVTVVCPGFFPTQLLRSAYMHTQQHREFAERAMQNARISPDDVAAAVLDAVTRNRPYVVLPSRARWYWRIKRFAPTWFSNFILRRYRQVLATPD